MRKEFQICFSQLSPPKYDCQPSCNSAKLVFLRSGKFSHGIPLLNCRIAPSTPPSSESASASLSAVAVQRHCSQEVLCAHSHRQHLRRARNVLCRRAAASCRGDCHSGHPGAQAAACAPLPAEARPGGHHRGVAVDLASTGLGIFVACSARMMVTAVAAIIFSRIASLLQQSLSEVFHASPSCPHLRRARP